MAASPGYQSDHAWLDRILAFAGIAMIYGAVGAFSLAGYLLSKARPALHAEEYLGEIIIGLIGAFAAVLGVRLLRLVGLARNQQPNRVINQAEWDAICENVKAGNEDSVSQYIRLTSLTGFTGTFTKLGLTGLPLATIALTLFFSLLALWRAETFLDLAKLTLGAFVGSFVQKQVTTGQGASVKLPTGETLRVQPPSEFA
jgi:hypothetical protein